MKRVLLLLLTVVFIINSSKAQDIVAAANRFINTLNPNQRLRAHYPFDADEHYNFHFCPKEDRKGISLNELQPAQKQVALSLMKTCLREQAVKKTSEIMELENVLK